jgi:hypothetical protein
MIALVSRAFRAPLNRHVCYVIGPTGPERREISPGGSTSSLIEVTDGLEEGESVVLHPTRLFDGATPRADTAGPDELESAAIGALR